MTRRCFELICRKAYAYERAIIEYDLHAPNPKGGQT